MIFSLIADHSLWESSDKCGYEIPLQWSIAYGGLPNRWWARWANRKEYFDDAGILREEVNISNKDLRMQLGVLLNEEGSGDESIKSMSEHGDHIFGLHKDELAALIKVMASMLRLEPEKRITASEVAKLLSKLWRASKLL